MNGNLIREPRGSRCARRAVMLLLGAMLCLFLWLTAASLLQTSVIDIKARSMEVVAYVRDNVPLNVGVLGLVLLCLVLLERKWPGFWAQPDPKRLFLPIAALFVAFGFAWVFSVNSIPRADSAKIYDAALAAVAGDFQTLQQPGNYFALFPYQLGYVAVTELMIRVFGEGQYALYGAVNVLLLVLAYAGIAASCARIFRDRGVTNCCILLLGLCWQPLLFCTFVYGNVMGLMASAWAVYFLMRFLDRGRMRDIAASAALVALAVVAKQNFHLVEIAICIVLLLRVMASKGKRVIAGLLAIAMVALLPTVAQRGAVSLYKARAGATLQGETSVPMSAWLTMGLQESERAPGWFNRYTYDIMEKNGLDAEVANAQIQADLSERLQAFADDPAYALDFFVQKALSQWNEVEFESIWVSQTKEHASEVSDYVTDIYTGSSRDVLHEYFNQYVQLLYTLFCIGLFFMMRALRRGDSENGAERWALLPLIVFGAFLYHLLFEAKSQYALVFIPLMTPVAAFGAMRLGAPGRSSTDLQR